MDEYSNKQELSLSFLDSSHELLNECNQAESFFYQWLELLEDNFDLAPIYLNLPLLQGNQHFFNDSRLEQQVTQNKPDQISKETNISGLSFYPLLSGHDDCFFVIPTSIRDKNETMFSIFQHYLPFFIQQIIKIDTLGRKLKLARFELNLESLVKNEADELDLLDTFLQNSPKEHAFIYYINSQKLITSKPTMLIYEQYRSSFDHALRQVIHDRQHYQNEEFHSSIKGLVLYPLYSSEDLFAVFGSFSQKNAVITALEMSYICQFCSNQANVSCLADRNIGQFA